MIYLDNASTTWPKPPNTLEQMKNHVLNVGASPGRGGYHKAKESESLVETARSKLAQMIGTAKARNISFTQNATHALNIIIKGFLKPGDHVILSCLEHNSILRPIERLRREQKIECDVFWPDDDGNFNIRSLAKLKRQNTRLIIINHASNVTGQISPVKAVAQWAHENNVKILIDVSQSAGLVPIEADKWSADFIAGTGHKSLFGPTGTGFMFARDPSEIQSLYEGGSPGHSLSPLHPQLGPEKFEAGTLNIIGIAGLLGGLEYISSNDPVIRLNKKMNLAKTLERKLSELTEIVIYGSDCLEKVPVVAMNLIGMSPNHLAFELDKFNIACRPGLQCAPLAHQSIGTYPVGTVRFSFGDFNEEDEVAFLVKSIKEIVSTRKMYKYA